MSITIHQSMARFAAVALIELIALGLCLFPLIPFQQSWRRDCFVVGLATTIAALGVIAVVSIVAFGWPKSKKDTTSPVAMGKILEVGIVVLYVLNIVSLSLVISLSGGVHGSFYAPLIPIQLSVMLFLEVQREAWTSRRPAFAGVVATLAIFALVIVHFKSDTIGGWVSFTDAAKNAVSVAEMKEWHLGLIAGGMILTYLTYWLPQNQSVQKKLEEWY